MEVSGQLQDPAALPPGRCAYDSAVFVKGKFASKKGLDILRKGGNSIFEVYTII
jgi:hypothetical protein